MDAFDFIVVGSGSAGSVLANRLSEDGRNRVLVLEYGGTDWGPFIQMPAALSYPMNMPLYDWGFRRSPSRISAGGVLVTPRGKVIGGSSSINGMVYVRGHARDFDALGGDGCRRLGLSPCAALFQAARGFAWRGGRLARHGRAASRHPRRRAPIRSTRPSSRLARRPATGDRRL